MIDRYSASGAMYNCFDHAIRVPSLKQDALFYHEYYHHVQNVSTILGGERLNLLVQFLAHITNLAASHGPLEFPLNGWYEREDRAGTLSPTLRRRLENLVFHQDEWHYLDKCFYPPRLFSADECFDDYLAVLKNEEKEAVEPYLLRRDDGLVVGYPIGGLAVTESGAYALECWHRNVTSAEELPAFNPSQYQYRIILDLVATWIPDFRLACLATFLWCDLALIIATPSIGFLALYDSARMFFSGDMDEGQLLGWYFGAYRANRASITANLALEQEVIDDIRARMRGLDPPLESMFNWQLDIMERGLRLREREARFFVTKMLSTDPEMLAELLRQFPLTVIETTEDEMMHYTDATDESNYGLLNAAYHLFISCCRAPQQFEENGVGRHLDEVEGGSYRVRVKLDADGGTDAIGYLLHTFGLDGEEVRVAG